MLPRATPERLSAFSDGVFAVLITVLVLELRPPEIPTFKALLELWPTWLSYAVNYLFIAIVWVNHHYLMRYATEANSRLLWFNFAHLFSMSLLPLSTAWMAISKLAPEPVAFYAAVFFLVNATYICLIRELVERPLRPRRGDRAEIPFRRTRNLYLLSGCLSQARSAWSGKEKISLGLEVDNWPSLKRAKAKDAARSRSHPPDPRVRSRQNWAASSPTRPRAG